MNCYVRSMLLLLAGALCACTSQHTYEQAETFTWSDLSEPVALQGDSVVFDEAPLKPTRVAVVDSFLLTKNQNVERFFLFVRCRYQAEERRTHSFRQRTGRND